MKVNKISLITALALMLSIGTYAPAFALDYGISGSGSASAGTGVQVGSGSGQSQVGASGDVNTSVDVNGNAQSGNTSSSDNSNGSVSGNGSGNGSVGASNNGGVSASVNSEGIVNASTSADIAGSVTADLHRSSVASHVLNLLKVANREGGIGAEVRAIAQAQNDSASTTADAMVKVEKRNGFATFLFGSDYKNLGMIRSELAKTKNQIARLKVLADAAVTVQDKAELNAQISLLEADQAKVDAFVTAHENTFSVLGWFVKIFVK